MARIRRRRGGEDLDAALKAAPETLDPALRDGLTCKDRAFYIFTSGTTGLPKAANISHMRMLFMMYGFAGALDANERDRMYNVLPLYHTAGGICALGPAADDGRSLIIRRKFSVHEFWEDCHRYRPTFFQYIGELCRYLLNAPARPARDAIMPSAPSPATACGPRSGRPSRSDLRFPKIVEFYGATEGNVSMLNYDGKVGAVGRIPSYMRSIMTTRIVRFDVEREMPVRGRRRLLHRMRTGRGRRGDRQDHRRSGQELRGLYEEGRHREEDPARRVRDRAMPGSAPAIS